MQVLAGHPNGGAQKAGTVDARVRLPAKVLCREGMDSQGRAQSTGSINIYGTCGIVNEGKWKKEENRIRNIKRKHLFKTIYWLQTLVCKAHSGSASSVSSQPALLLCQI